MTNNDLGQPRKLRNSVCFTLLCAVVILAALSVYVRERHDFPVVSDVPDATCLEASFSEDQHLEAPSKEGAVEGRSLEGQLEPFRSWLVSFEAGESDLAEGLVLVQQRAPVMKRLMQEDPKLAYEHAVSYEVWQQLPAELRAHLEHRFKEPGSYTVENDCFGDQVFRNISTKAFSSCSASVVPELMDCRRFQGMLSGVVFDGDVAITGMEGDGLKEPDITPANSPSVGYFSILWLNVKYSNQTNYPSAARMGIVTDSFESYSYERLSVTYDVVDVAVTSALGIAAADLRIEAKAAALAMGYDATNYSVTVYRTTNLGNFSNIGGVYVHVSEAREDVAVHEIGHCMGLHHSNWWEPNAGQPSWGEGTNILYAQNWVTMGLRPNGSQQRRDFNAPEKKILGWLDAGSDYIDNVTSGVYRIYAYDGHAGNFSSNGVDGAYYGVTVFKDTKAVNGEAADRRYFLSFSIQPYFDDAIYNPWYANGICLHWEPWTKNGSAGYNTNAPYGTTIVDAHPGSAGSIGTYDEYTVAKESYDAPVLIGETYIDNDPGNRDGAIRITPLRKVDPDGIARSGDEYIDVKVVVGGDQSGNQAPTAALSASAVSARVGESISFTVSASDADDTELGYLWDFGVGTTGVDRRIMPLDGQAAQHYCWYAPGTYTVKVTVTDGRGGSVVASKEVMVTGDVRGSWKPFYLCWDAAQDVPGDATWTASGTEYDWVFDGGAQVPSTVSSPKFATLTKAYDFPGARDDANDSFDSLGSDLPASFELVIDVDADGLIFETGGNTDGFMIFVSAGVLKAIVSENPDVVVSTPLTVEEKSDFIHVVVVADNQANELLLFVDGVLRDSAPWTAGEDWSGTGGSGLGGSDANTADGIDHGDFRGRIAIFRFYRDTVLDGPRVVANYNELAGPTGARLRTMTYDDNLSSGGVVPVDTSSPYADLAMVTVQGNTGSLVRSGYRFEGWNTQSSGLGSNYWPADTFSISANTTLYAHWGALTTNHAVPHSWIDIVATNPVADYEAAVMDDPDNDGFSTWEEYWSGTDPYDSNSYLRIDGIVVSGTNATIQWQHSKVDPFIPTIAIQARSNLLSGSWMTVYEKLPADGLNSWTNTAQQYKYHRLAVTNAP